MKSPFPSRSSHPTGGSARTSDSRSRPIRVVVADGQVIDRKGLVGLLGSRPGFQVVGEAGTVADTIERCSTLKPDVLVLALSVQGSGHVPGVGEVHAALPELRILALAERGASTCFVLNPPPFAGEDAEGPTRRCIPTTDCLELAVVQGAHGTLRRDADPDDLFRAVRELAAGNAWYEPRTAAALASGTLPSQQDGARLSPRELQVAGLLAEGLTNRDIARRLGIGEPTVKKHVGRIFDKLGTGDRLQAGLLVARNPLLLRPQTGHTR